jgi:hypothetical protein
MDKPASLSNPHRKRQTPILMPDHASKCGILGLQIIAVLEKTKKSRAHKELRNKGCVLYTEKGIIMY